MFGLGVRSLGCSPPLHVTGCVSGHLSIHVNVCVWVYAVGGVWQKSVWLGNYSHSHIHSHTHRVFIPCADPWFNQVDVCVSQQEWDLDHRGEQTFILYKTLGLS